MIDTSIIVFINRMDKISYIMESIVCVGYGYLNNSIFCACIDTTQLFASCHFYSPVCPPAPSSPDQTSPLSSH